MSDNPAIHREACHMLLGDRIGYGMSRIVYRSCLNERDVIKVEEAGGSFQNVIEWELWQRVNFTPMAKWFAPCLHISPCGAVLVMRKTEAIPAAMYPREMPSFFTDLKRDNFGLFRGKLVCHDYGVSFVTERGLSEKMRRAHWR